MVDEEALIGWREKKEFRFNKKYKVIPARNESGVVFLFGVCHKDFHFESVVFYNCFPDASAMFLPLHKRIKIEFEFNSSNFITHNHEIGEVDLIICWKHDIFSIPKPVFELSSGLFFKRIQEDTIKTFRFKNSQKTFNQFIKFWENG